MEWKTLLQQAVSERTIKALPSAMNIVLILALAYFFAQFTWLILPVPNLDEELIQPTGTVKRELTSRVKKTSLVGQLSEWHLFGSVPKVEEAKASPKQVEAPLTRLNLTLRGVVSSKSDLISKAIIADSSGKENFYSIGAKVPGGAELTEIFTDRVILKRNDRLETLQLPKEVPFNEGDSRSRSKRARNTTSTFSPTSGNTGALLRDYRDKLINDPQSVMNLIRAQPVKEKGKLIGYRIRPGRDRKLLRQFGLRSGDVVTAVNGISLDNPIKGLEIMKDLSSATQISIEIKRNNVPQSMTFQID